MKLAKSGFLTMVLAVLGIVLIVTMFSSIMTAIAALWNNAAASTFTAFQTALGITPTVLFLGTIFGGAFAYWRGYKKVEGEGSDPGGLIRMVFGILVLILFCTLFATILTAMGSLNTTYGSNTSYIAFGTVIQISPTILFLLGIFGGGSTAIGGMRARKGSKSLR